MPEVTLVVLDGPDGGVLIVTGTLVREGTDIVSVRDDHDGVLRHHHRSAILSMETTTLTA